MSDNVNRIYADAYANKVLKKELRPKVERSNFKKPQVRSKGIHAQQKPIDKHGNYEGTDVGFTSTSIQNSNSKKKTVNRRKKPIDQHGNYEGTDVGFTAKFDD
ncbi:MAG TPA: hypothetical protein EYM28_01615 [Rhodospirillales bacterium]|jgi:penicillin-binding protein-related factor A (putative recombinase)|nr:hypothetical protein [Rhodospirillales bacterium]